MLLVTGAPAWAEGKQPPRLRQGPRRHLEAEREAPRRLRHRDRQALLGQLRSRRAAWPARPAPGARVPALGGAQPRDLSHAPVQGKEAHVGGPLPQDAPRLLRRDQAGAGQGDRGDGRHRALRRLEPGRDPDPARAVLARRPVPRRAGGRSSRRSASRRSSTCSRTIRSTSGRPRGTR